MLKGKRILICPLDWGLGHATRCIPIIRLLLEKNAEVIIATDKQPLALLKKEFPSLKFIVFKGYEINYSRTNSMVLSMFFSIPKIIRAIKREHIELNRIIDENNIDVVISDNRYGCWSKKTKSIFITHQLMIKSPFGENFLHHKILKYIKNFDECWIPDYEGADNLSGELSHKYKIPANTFFIGPLSRFKFVKNLEMEYDIMAIISGPEPQRSIFEKQVAEQIYKSDLKALVVYGIPEKEIKIETKQNVKMISHLSAIEMEECISKSKIIIARSGYSTIMDLATLGKKAFFVPTPGQTEQEYLAELLKSKKVSFFQNQKIFDLQLAMSESEKYSGFNPHHVNENLLALKISNI